MKLVLELHRHVFQFDIHILLETYLGLDIAYFAENLKFIAKNIVAKYFLKLKTLTLASFFCGWLVHEECVGPEPQNTKGSKTPHPNAHLLFIVYRSYMGPKNI